MSSYTRSTKHHTTTKSKAPTRKNTPDVTSRRPESKPTSAPRTATKSTAAVNTSARLAKTTKVVTAPTSSTKALAANEAITPQKTKPNRAVRFMDSVASVQEPRQKGKPWPRWRKIATWAVMLMPVYAIVIYIIGFFFFLQPSMQGVGVNTSFKTNVTATVGGISIPDQEGVFLQQSGDASQQLNLIEQWNSRTLQPPVSSQPILKPTDLKYLLVRQAQVLTPEDYKLYRIADNQPDVLLTTMHAERVSGASRVAMIAISMPNGAPWPVGSYMLDVPEAGLFNGDYYCFFTIQA